MFLLNDSVRNDHYMPRISTLIDLDEQTAAIKHIETATRDGNIRLLLVADNKELADILYTHFEDLIHIMTTNGTCTLYEYVQGIYFEVTESLMLDIVAEPPLREENITTEHLLGKAIRFETNPKDFARRQLAIKMALDNG